MKNLTSWAAAKFFSWMQETEFYHSLHRKAVEALPPGRGQIWIDVGCGPGLITRLASAHGYQAMGFDYNSEMIKTAKKIAKQQGSSANFRVANVSCLPPEAAEVVSAASLLAVLDDKISGLNTLWKCVNPGGALLIVEPTDKMTAKNAGQLIKQQTIWLRLWANARQGRAVDPRIFNALGAEQIQFIPLLHGLVGAWVIRKTVLLTY